MECLPCGIHSLPVLAGFTFIHSQTMRFEGEEGQFETSCLPPTPLRTSIPHTNHRCDPHPAEPCCSVQWALINCSWIQLNPQWTLLLLNPVQVQPNFR